MHSTGQQPVNRRVIRFGCAAGDALYNLADVSTSALEFVGFRASRKLATERCPYGFERAEDLAGCQRFTELDPSAAGGF